MPCLGHIYTLLTGPNPFDTDEHLEPYIRVIQ